MILIITPVYKAWDKVKMCCDHVDKNTSSDFLHVLITDSCEAPESLTDTASVKRAWLHFDDELPPEKHRPNITKALQKGWDFAKTLNQPFSNVFVVESDVMLPLDWDKTLVNLSSLLPKEWQTLDVLPIDEDGHTTYPARDHNIRRGHEIHAGHQFEIVQYGDWNAILLNPQLVDNLGITWRFDDVPSHHDILLSRNFREKMGLEREIWAPATFYRTEEVKAVHYANSSRSQLPEGLLTPSNPA